MELEKKKAEAAAKRDRERKISEGARFRERNMLNNIGGIKAELVRQEEERRREEEEQERLLEVSHL